MVERARRVAVTVEQCWHRVPGGTATSTLGKDPAKRWSLYERMLRAAWGGRIGDVLSALGLVNQLVKDET